MSHGRCVLIVCDGLADRPLYQLNGSTPLEAVDSLALDEIAGTGICGIMDTLSPGVPPGSDVANLALLGYDPYKVYRGRGALEALGCGLSMRAGDVAFRTNFATVDEDLVVLDRRAGRRIEHAERLEEALKGLSLPDYPDIRVVFKHSVEHRGALVLHGGDLSRMVSSSDPGKRGLKVRMVTPLDDSPEAARTASMANELSRLSYSILKDHPVNADRRKKDLPPANILLLRGPGELPSIESLDEKYGIKSAAVVANALVRGACLSAGMKVIEVPGATGRTDTDTLAKGRYAADNISRFDLIYLHVKGADNASHDGNLEEKMKMVEKIDAMARYILDHVDREDVYVAITADHTSPISLKAHSGDPVPVAITGPGVRVDDVTRFTERACARGSLGRIRGHELMTILMDFLGRVEKFGA